MSDPDPAEALTVHLFACVSTGHFAVSTESYGTNLPLDNCLAGWIHDREFALGVREVLPFGHNPEPVIREIRDAGYYILGSITPHGTSQ